MLYKVIICIAVTYYLIAAYGRYHHLLPWHRDATPPWYCITDNTRTEAEQKRAAELCRKYIKRRGGYDSP